MTDLGYDVKYEPKIVYHNKGFRVNKWFDAWEKFRNYRHFRTWWN